ncbi:preprotein translocase subunit YajC [Sphingomonas gellani]|nr:preprotein translocase subunit YajC [Sphingomonas gellani]
MFISPAYAQTVGAGAESGAGGLIGMFAPLALVFVAFYFLVLRPQAKRQKEFQARVESVKKGDTVVTAGGIVARVTRVEDKHVEVEIAPNTRVRVVKSTLAEVTSLNAKPAND